MRFIPLSVCLLAFCATRFLCADGPEVDSIDYAHPDIYRDFPDSLGDRAAILAQASKLKGKSKLQTIRNVLHWMDKNLQYDGKIAYQWRNYDDVMREKKYGGCADQGIVCGVLLKGAGIPTVWVKTMDVAWIWTFKKERPFSSWSGHVFLEVFVDGKWSLLDPGGKTLYQNYSPKMKLLPGQRFAYHKGNDPKAMVMSLQWEEWKKQTTAYFRQLDETLLPVDEKGGTSLVPMAYVIGNSPYYQALTAMAVKSGLRAATSFNCQYDKYLPEANGHVILIETHEGKPIVPQKVLEKYYPKAFAGLSRPSKSIRIKNTRIVFVDPSEPSQKAIEKTLSEFAETP
ncbi:MAG: transglutaminase domain-containing protein [Thermoguttaceae bacterium]